MTISMACAIICAVYSFIADCASGLLPKAKVFIGNRYSRICKLMGISYVLLLFCSLANSATPIFTENAHSPRNSLESHTDLCGNSTYGKECRQSGFSENNFPNGLPIYSSTTCWEAAGAHFSIDPLLLKAIAWKESRGRPDAIGPILKNGDRALGLMQINTVHLKKLKQFGIEQENLFDACVSQEVAAWVLSDCITKFGSTWKAVGCYYTGPNSSNFNAQLEYVRDVQRIYVGYQKQEQQKLNSIQKE